MKLSNILSMNYFKLKPQGDEAATVQTVERSLSVLLNSSILLSAPKFKVYTGLLDPLDGQSLMFSYNRLLEAGFGKSSRSRRYPQI